MVKKRCIFLMTFLAVTLLLSGCLFSPKMKLHISVDGQGTVLTNPDNQSEGYKKDSIVQLEAVPAEGWVFSKWEQDLSGINPKMSLKMDTAKEVKAMFVKARHDLNIIVQGEGTVSEEIVLSKGTNYEHNTMVKLTANPAEGWRFSHWEGDLTGSTNPATVTMDSSKDVKAVFMSAIIRVPDDYPTIQSAIDAAINGSIIIVSPRTYYENINFNGKSNITLKSTNPLDPAVVESTIINGNQQGACIIIENGAQGIIISGLTITGGSERSRDGSTYGGGVFVTNFSEVTITDCTISGNTASSYGAGVSVIQYSDATITDSNISSNTAFNGGGVSVILCSDVTITGSTISENTASSSGGGVYVHVDYSRVTITDSNISGNTASRDGGGVYVYSSSYVTITDSTISGNEGINGGGVYLNSSGYFSSGATITGSTISKNTASRDGGGIWKSASSTITNLNDEPLTTPDAVEAINEFSNNTPDNFYFE